MRTSRQCRGITAAELIVTLAAVGLLLGFGVAAAGRARQFDTKTQCLANMREIGRASWLYATDDRLEQIVPISRALVSRESWTGFGGETGYARAAEAYAYGGRTAVTPMPRVYQAITVMTEPTSVWSAEHRPLNGYIGAGGLEVFHCPADQGYPDEAWAGEFPSQAAGLPCYDLLGNSYRINTTGYTQSDALRFTTAPLMHSGSAVSSPAGETVLYNEPLFYNLARSSSPPWTTVPEAFGWHGVLKSDNVLFLDGSAGLRRVDPLRRFTQAELEQMNFSPLMMPSYHILLRRGPGWQMDAYPTPGAFYYKYWPDAQTVPALSVTGPGWPYDNLIQHLPPQ